MKFKFGKQVGRSVATINACVPQDEGSYILLDDHVVHCDIPFLKGLYIFNSRLLLVKFVETSLKVCYLTSVLPLTWKCERLFS